MTELPVLQGVRLKGRVRPYDLATTIGTDLATVGPVIDALVEAGLLRAGQSLRLTAEGRARLRELLAHEREGTDEAALAAAYRSFREVNAAFKQVVTDWQLKDGSPNAHDDHEYDAAVLARLDRVHEAAMPVVDAAVAHLPRLDGYAHKLRAALDKVHAGDTAWLTRPAVDSYHTVWFELHEELIGAAGLTREGEAAAGHA